MIAQLRHYLFDSPDDVLPPAWFSDYMRLQRYEQFTLAQLNGGVVRNVEQMRAVEAMKAAERAAFWQAR